MRVINGGQISSIRHVCHVRHPRPAIFLAQLISLQEVRRVHWTLFLAMIADAAVRRTDVNDDDSGCYIVCHAYMTSNPDISSKQNIHNIRRPASVSNVYARLQSQKFVIRKVLMWLPNAQQQQTHSEKEGSPIWFGEKYLGLRSLGYYDAICNRFLGEVFKLYKITRNIYLSKPSIMV